MNKTLIHNGRTTMPTPRIVVSEDGLVCKADFPLRDAIYEALKYNAERTKQTQFSTVMVPTIASFIDKRNGVFLRGLLTRATQHLNAIKMPYILEDNAPKDYPPWPLVNPRLKGITLRPKQVELAALVARDLKGVIVSPTGSGKTIIGLAIISMWPNARSLILTHSLDILKQFEQRARQYLPNTQLQVVKGGAVRSITGQLVVSTIQSFSKIPIKDVFNIFDITIIDEAHRCGEKKGMFGRWMASNLAPVKVGLTATPHPERRKLLAMEGLIGPIIGEVTNEEGKKQGMIVDAYVNLIPVPYDMNIGNHKKYRDIYRKGIVCNTARNALIIKAVRDRIATNGRVLVLIREIDQGKELLKIAGKFKVAIQYVYGASDSATRDRVKAGLSNGSIRAAIASDIWREGVDIPELTTVIIAGSGKSELQTLQGVGRGLRPAAGKTKLEIIDMLDPYRYLARHTMARLITYVKRGWLCNNKEV